MGNYNRIYEVYLQAIETTPGNSTNPPELAAHQTNIIGEIGQRKARDRRDPTFQHRFLNAYAELVEAGGPELIFQFHRSKYINQATALADGKGGSVKK